MRFKTGNTEQDDELESLIVGGMECVLATLQEERDAPTLLHWLISARRHLENAEAIIRGEPVPHSEDALEFP